MEALNAGPAKPVAKLLERQDGGCAFFYKDTDYCIKHTDKSLTNERIMLRLTQTPTKTHYLMIEGDDHVVYNIQMQGSFVYGGRDDATILAKRPHAVPKPTYRRRRTAQRLAMWLSQHGVQWLMPPPPPASAHDIANLSQ